VRRFQKSGFRETVPPLATDVVIFKIFSQKMAKILTFFAQTTAMYFENI
jgi:hypothetical protein